MREDVMREAGTLPPEWVWMTLGEITDTTRMRADPQDYPDARFIGMEHVEAHTMRLLGTIPAREMHSSAERFKPGDILYGRLRPYLNKVLSPDFAGLCSGEFIIFRKVPHLENRYLRYFLNSADFVSFASHLNAGDRPRVNFEQLADYPFPLPPLSEQRRIVAEIEKQFTRLDAGVAALKRVQANLRRYRTSVLKAACEGRLASQDPADEPADRLLARILVERRAKWEAEHPGKKCVEPVEPVTDGLLELPVGWRWTSVEQIGEVTGGLTKNQKRDVLPTRLPYLRVANVYADELRLDDLLTIGIEDREIKRALLRDGDLLVVEGNGSADQIGRVAIWHDTGSPCVHQNHIIKIRFDPVDLGPYILYWLLSDGGRDQITQVASSTSGLYTLSLSKVAALLIPLPPLPEQHRIVAEVERRLSVVAAMEATVAANLARAGRLRQAVLKRAFEGRLVGQDPSLF